MFKFDHFGVILFVSFSYKNCYNVHFVKIEKIDAKIDFSAKNSKKFVYYNEELVTNSKFQAQLSRKLQRFRICRKNKKCSIFHDLSEYIIFHMIVTYSTGPLISTSLIHNRILFRKHIFILIFPPLILQNNICQHKLDLLL